MNERIKFCLEWQRRWDEAEGGRVDVIGAATVDRTMMLSGMLWPVR